MELIGLYYEHETIHWMGDSHYSMSGIFKEHSAKFNGIGKLGTLY